ncbi:hypothetical protein DERP_001801 [Dermatophagoides pteronyssinus]|uniref:Uncharacterized protein n=1 Tax=Dermatophagoides pteronyssinus TaxID=6956 RepID=A0ABQ8JBP1_DERPT|nr:hypothetical protein DERP_001801 [Dermatophagoides pteronyssinus]
MDLKMLIKSKRFVYSTLNLYAICISKKMKDEGNKKKLSPSKTPSPDDDSNHNATNEMAEIIQTPHTKVKIIYRKHNNNHDDELPEVELTNIERSISKNKCRKEIELVQQMIEENVKLNKFLKQQSQIVYKHNNVQQQNKDELRLLIKTNENDDDEETCYKQIKQLIAQRSKEDSNRRKNTK